MPAVPSQYSQQRMSLTQPSGPSSYTTPLQSSGHPWHAFRPFQPANYSRNVPHPTEHHQPYHLVTSSSMRVTNPYAKSNAGHAGNTIPPHLTVTSTYVQQSTTYPHAHRSPLRDLGGTGGQVLPQPKSSTHFLPIPKQLGPTMARDYTNQQDSPFMHVPSQNNPDEHEPNISYGPSFSSSSSETDSLAPMIDLQASPFQQEKRSFAAVTSMESSIAFDYSPSSDQEQSDRRGSTSVIAALSGFMSPSKRPPPQGASSLSKPPPPLKSPTSVSVDPPPASVPVDPSPAAVNFSTADLARFVLNSENLYGNTDITTSTRDLTGVSSRHSKRCGDLLSTIFMLLANHPSREMQYLAEDVRDSETGLMTKQFWVHLAGEPSDAKKQLLNAILLIFSHWYRKVEYRNKDIAQMSAQERAEVSLSKILLSPLPFYV
jgi:hypothetical protein